MELMKNQIRTAGGALWDVLLRTVPTAGATTWLVCYAADWNLSDILGFVTGMQPIRPLLRLLMGGW